MLIRLTLWCIFVLELPQFLFVWQGSGHRIVLNTETRVFVMKSRLKRWLLPTFTLGMDNASCHINYAVDRKSNLTTAKLIYFFWQKSLIKIYSYIWARETLLPQSTESLKSVPKNWQILMPDLVHYIYCLYTWYLPILLPKPKTSQCWIVQAV